MSLSALDKLLEGGNVKVIEHSETPEKKSGLFKTIIAIAALSIGATGLYLYDNQSNTTTVNDPSVMTKVGATIKESVVSAANNVPSVAKEEAIKNPVNTHSNLINDKNKSVLEQIAQFDVPTNYKDNQVARHVAQHQYAKKEFYLSIVSEAESFRRRFYNDNIGYAFGNGWNVSLQSKSYNENLAKAVSQDGKFINAITSLSGKTGTQPISGSYSDIIISPQKSMQVAYLMGEKFEEGVLNGIEKHMRSHPTAQKKYKETGKNYEVLAKELFNSLQPNEQAALKYHAYKVGSAGFGAYKGLISNLIEYGYSTDKSIEKKKKVSEHFTYKYRINGEVKQDVRASVILSTMFDSPEAFGYTIGKNVAPRDISSRIPVFKSNNIEITNDPSQLVIPDPVGEAKAAAMANGGEIKIELLPSKEINTINKPKPKVSSVSAAFY